MSESEPAARTYEDFPIIVCKMWETLAEAIADGIPGVYIADGPEAAIRHAWCAEACYWQAMGDADSSSVKNLITPLPIPHPERTEP